MKLTPFALSHLKDYITGDNGLTPKNSGPKIISLFNTVGIRDIYQQGMPGNISRKDYTFSKLQEINDSERLRTLLESVFSSLNFLDSNLDLKTAVEKANIIIVPEGYKLVEVDGKYLISGTDIYNEVKTSEIHFEEIRDKLIVEIKKAKYLIWVAVAWFTDPVLFDLLAEKRRKGLSVQAIILDDDINNNCGLDFSKGFYTQKVPKRGVFENLMHHKFCIVDLKTVIHGTYNWTKKAQFNNETLDVEIGRANAEKFTDEFMKIKNS